MPELPPQLGVLPAVQIRRLPTLHQLLRLLLRNRATALPGFQLASEQPQLRLLLLLPLRKIPTARR